MPPPEPPAPDLSLPLSAWASEERTPREVVNPDLLEKAGLELQVDRQSGKVQLKRPDATAAAGAPRPPAAATIEEEPVAESWDKEGSASGRTLE